MKKLIDKDPFYSGTEHVFFDTYNCDKCVKDSVYDEKTGKYTNADKDNMPNRCSVLRDIMTRMVSSIPIKEETVRICRDFIERGVPCPYLQTERNKPRTTRQKGQTKLFDN